MMTLNDPHDPEQVKEWQLERAKGRVKCTLLGLGWFLGCIALGTIAWRLFCYWSGREFDLGLYITFGTVGMLTDWWILHSRWNENERIYAAAVEQLNSKRDVDSASEIA